MTQFLKDFLESHPNLFPIIQQINQRLPMKTLLNH
jgi:hypothetical protein